MPPTGKYFWLTEDDRKLLDELAQERRKTVRLPRYESPEYQPPSTPEVYEARTPSGGIPALTEVAGDDSPDIPGYATCEIYQIIRDYPEAQPRLVKIENEDKIVYNLNLTAIGANRWIDIRRDKFGNWIASLPHPSPESDDPTGEPGETGTGTGGVPPDDDDDDDEPDPVYSDTGTGTNTLHTGGPGGIYYPCGSITLEETDVFCEPALSTLHTIGFEGLSGTGPAAPDFYLNLYKRTLILGINRFTGCLERAYTPWDYVRTVGCCEPECAHPDSGTGVVTADTCCARGSLYSTVGYTLSGPVGPTLPTCTPCTVAGSLHQIDPPDGLRWTNSAGGSTCGGRAFLELTLYCSGTSWRASGKLRRYLPGIQDTTQSFDVALVFNTVSTLNATIDVPGCADDMLLSITMPCYSYNCVDGSCQEVFGDGGTYRTVEECEVGCVASGPDIVTACCPGGIPSTVTLSFTAGCVGLPDPIPMIYDAGGAFGAGWYSALQGCGSIFRLECEVTDWKLKEYVGGFQLGTGTATGSCDPLSISGTAAFSGSCCSLGPSFTITE